MIAGFAVNFHQQSWFSSSLIPGTGFRLWFLFLVLTSKIVQTKLLPTVFNPKYCFGSSFWEVDVFVGSMDFEWLCISCRDG